MALAALILAVFAATAAADVFTGDNSDNTIIGTPRPDQITDGNGNNVIYGLNGADTITAGDGNNVIDGDGHCMPGANSANARNYCSHGPIPGDGGDTITAGDGNDVVFGGGGDNTIKLGNGDNYILGGPQSDTITAGDGNNSIYLSSGSNKVTVGAGSGNRIWAYHDGDTGVDHITCGNPGSVAYVNKQDVVHGCRVSLPSASAGSASRHRRGPHHRSHGSHNSKRRLTF